MIDFNELIRRARQALYYTQNELGDILGVTGCQISNYEANIRSPGLRVKRTLLDFLETKGLNYLIRECNEQKKTGT